MKNLKVTGPEFGGKKSTPLLRVEMTHYLDKMITGVFGFSYFAIEHIRKHGTKENFDKLNFRSVKTIMLFIAIFKGFCVFRSQLSKCCSKLSRKLSIES